jgi:hypothetical protein
VPKFVPGLELARTFYRDVVGPIVADVPHSAALVGEGSEVLGFDSPRSTDHSWGPRLQLFLEPGSVEQVRQELNERLPEQYAGWPVQFYSWQTGQVEHHVEVTTIDDWLKAQLGFDPRAGVPLAAWLATSQQTLLEVTGGAVFHDDLGPLTDIRDALKWYPTAVWLWLMACQWSLIAKSEALVGRTAEAGDELGSRLVVTRLARDLIRLCFLQEGRYAPYDKWLSTAFSRLLAPDVVDVAKLARASNSPEREQALVAVLEAVARRHNDLGLTPNLDPLTDQFDVGIGNARRPYRVLNANRFAKACQEAITDEHLRRLELVGSIDQLTNASDLLIHFTDWPSRLRAIYNERLSR